MKTYKLKKHNVEAVAEFFISRGPKKQNQTNHTCSIETKSINATVNVFIYFYIKIKTARNLQNFLQIKIP